MTDLKIEAGKCYETRDGRRAYVLYADDDGQGWSGAIRDHSGPMLVYGAWLDNGKCAARGDDPEDLISEWKEPRKGEVWVTVSKHGVLDELVVCAHEYPVPSDRRCLAILGPIPWTEGQGLDGQEAEKLEKAWRGAAAKVFLNSPGGELQSGEGSE